MPLFRRQILSSLKALTAGSLLTGCITRRSTGTEPSPSQSQTQADPDAAPAQNCPEGYKSFKPWWSVNGQGPIGGFELRLDRENYNLGDELTAKLRNVTDEEQISGVKRKFDIQYKDDRWRTIFGLPENVDPVWSQAGVRHPPGEGFTWRLTLSKDGLSEGNIESAPSFHACQMKEPGHYRFVYWGVGGAEVALGVQFNVIQG